MNDREKVVKGLECCLIYGDGCDKCADCPYLQETDCIRQNKRDALALLKAQEEKPLRCDKCSYHREDGWCGMHGRWVMETDYCSLGAWKDR